jgi:hypothetical protein
MRTEKNLLFVIFFVISTSAFGQTFEGSSVDERFNYHCLLQINPDSSVTYIYDRDDNGIYAEYVGQLQKAKDATYAVKAKLAIGQYYMKSFHPDTLYIKLDSTIAGALDKISVTYANNKKYLLYRGYDSLANPISLIKIPIDKELFNADKGTDFVTITVNRKNRITRNWISFTIPFGSAAFITAGQTLNMEVKIEKDTVRTVGDRPTQTGHILLHKMK